MAPPARAFEELKYQRDADDLPVVRLNSRRGASLERWRSGLLATLAPGRWHSTRVGPGKISPSDSPHSQCPRIDIPREVQCRSDR